MGGGNLVGHGLLVRKCHLPTETGTGVDPGGAPLPVVKLLLRRPRGGDHHRDHGRKMVGIAETHEEDRRKEPRHGQFNAE